MTLAIVVIGTALAATPLLSVLGFTRLPVVFRVPGSGTVTYRVMVEGAKQQLVRRLGL